jgi:release factor glutamine methyltransferase
MEAALAQPTVGAILAETIDRLARAGVPEPRADAEVLLAHVLGTSRAGVIAGTARSLSDGAGGALEALVVRRAGREPLHYLLGEREFWSLPLVVDRRVLVPRPETELLVETVLALAPRARRVLDVGTGSGAVAVALARELPEARVWASDVDRDALAVAGVNRARHAPGVELVAADLLSAFRPGRFDVVVSNPPYLAAEDYARLPPEIRLHEPRQALLAGADGFAAIRLLLDTAADVLVAGGWLVVELGMGQAETVRAEAVGAGRWTAVRTVRDHAGIERVLVAARREAEGGR